MKPLWALQMESVISNINSVKELNWLREFYKCKGIQELIDWKIRRLKKRRKW